MVVIDIPRTYETAPTVFAADRLFPQPWLEKVAGFRDARCARSSTTGQWLRDTRCARSSTTGQRFRDARSLAPQPPRGARSSTAERSPEVAETSLLEHPTRSRSVHTT